jgi:pimeloyl-ACP methyl ester carboxylesterase
VGNGDVLDGWIDNRGVRLHYLDSGSEPFDPARVPLVIVPGLSEGAEDQEDLMAAVAPRRAVAISLRGRGKSEAPIAGYSLDDHVADVEALVEALRLYRFVLFGSSRGVSYATSYAARHPERLAGLILADYPAHHTELDAGWLDRVMETSWRGRPVAERMKRRALAGIQRESSYLPLWEGLRGVSCPALILRGGSEGSLLPSAEADRYRRVMPDATVVVFEDAGHDLTEPDPDRFGTTIREFLDGIDPALPVNGHSR